MAQALNPSGLFPCTLLLKQAEKEESAANDIRDLTVYRERNRKWRTLRRDSTGKQTYCSFWRAKARDPHSVLIPSNFHCSPREFCMSKNWVKTTSRGLGGGVCGRRQVFNFYNNSSLFFGMVTNRANAADHMQAKFPLKYSTWLEFGLMSPIGAKVLCKSWHLSLIAYLGKLPTEEWMKASGFDSMVRKKIWTSLDWFKPTVWPQEHLIHHI